MTNRIPKKTGEFSQTVSHYSQYRPDYPEDLFNLLKNKGYGAHSVIAGIGAGTGLLTKDLIKLNAEVIAVEPNAKMFAELEHQFSNQKKLSLLPNTAESTQLPQASIDLITVATAFHWFDRVKCRQEFRRILKPSGEALLVWNLRIPALSPFIADYEAFLQTYCPLYKGTPEM